MWVFISWVFYFLIHIEFYKYSLKLNIFNMDFKQRYTNNHQVNWQIQVQKYRNGYIIDPNQDDDRSIAPYNEYDLSDSDYDSDNEYYEQLGSK